LKGIVEVEVTAKLLLEDWRKDFYHCGKNSKEENPDPIRSQLGPSAF